MIYILKNSRKRYSKQGQSRPSFLSSNNKISNNSFSIRIYAFRAFLGIKL